MREAAPIPPELRWIAVALTWWTVAIETAIALLFLSPVEGLEAWEWSRALSLVVFAVTTFVAVPSFGEILLVMLLAATGSVALRWYVALLALGLIMMTFLPHFANWLAHFALRPRRNDETRREA